jgi:hypothetical protein
MPSSTMTSSGQQPLRSGSVRAYAVPVVRELPAPAPASAGHTAAW